MYSYKLNKLPKNTIEISVEINKETIKKEYQTAFLNLLRNLELPGFRKGNVPEKVGEKHIKKESVYQEVIRTLLVKIYSEIIEKEGLKPVISPKIELVKAKEDEDWQIKITVAEKPEVDLGNYKEIIKKLKAEKKKSDIWIPGKSTPDKNLPDKEKSKKRQQLLNSILDSVFKAAKLEISDLIIEEELNQRLSALLNDIQKIGLTVEAYLKSKNLTQESLKSNLRNEIEQTYKLEFILSAIADKENIKVENDDLEKLFSSITDPKEQESAKANSYFYASVLRKQKTLDYLLDL